MMTMAKAQPITANLDDNTLLTLAKACGFDEDYAFDAIWDGALTRKQKKQSVAQLKRIGFTQYTNDGNCIFPEFDDEE